MVLLFHIEDILPTLALLIFTFLYWVQVSLVWSVVKTMYSSKVGDFGQQIPSGNVSREEMGLGVLQTTLGTSTGLEPISAGAGGEGDQRSLLGVGGGETPRGAMSAGEDETETDETPEQHFNGRMGLGSLSVPQGDFFFGDGEMDPLSVDFDRMNNGMMGMSLSNGLLGGSHMLLDAQTQQDWTLPSEAFPLRHEIQDRSPPPEQFPNHGSPDLNDHGKFQYIYNEICS